MAEVIDNSGLSLLQTLGGMPMGAATGVSSGMPQAGGGMGLLAALLGGGQQRQAGIGAGGIDPRAIRMMLFQQMNRPAQGPFSAIANPIVAALMARQMGPQIAQQQQRKQDMERIKQVMEIMKASSTIKAQSATADYRGQQTQALEDEATLLAEMPVEERREWLRNKGGTGMTAFQKKTTEAGDLRAKAAAKQADVAGTRAGTYQQQVDDTRTAREAAQKQLDQHFNAQEKRIKEENAAVQTRYEGTETRKDWENIDLQAYRDRTIAQKNMEAADKLKVQRERIAAMGGSPEVQKAKLNLINARVDRTKQLMQQTQERDPATVDTLTNLFKMANEMPRDKAEEFLEENAAPLLAKLSGGKLKIPYDSWSVFSWGFQDINAPIDSNVSGGSSSAMLPTPGQTPVTPGAAPPAVNTPTGTIPPASDAKGLRERYLQKKYGAPIGQLPSVYTPQ